MTKKYRVQLTGEEQQELKALVSRGRTAAYKQTHARILLLSDEAQADGGMKDEEIARSLKIGSATVERVRRRCVEEGVEAAVGRFEYIKEGKITRETTYGITSLGPDQASPRRLLEIVRTHWKIENGLHYRRDETMREDWCHLRLGHAQPMMAAINNLVLGLLLRRGVRNVPRQRRRYAARWNEALKLITSV